LLPWGKDVIAVGFDLWTAGPARCHKLAVAPALAEWYVESIMKDLASAETKGPPSFHAVVEAADRLTPEEQETLIEVLNRRLAARQRAALAADIEDAQREFERGALRPATPREIIEEILS
jgi:hypothetical protein